MERSRQAILAATLELLAPDGDVGSLTVEAVAARSGVAKTTIYRRWRDKWELALDAVMIDTLPRFDEPVDLGDTRKELLTFVNSVVTMLAATPYGPAMQGLVSHIATDPELARTLPRAGGPAPPRPAGASDQARHRPRRPACAAPRSAWSTNSSSGPSSTACCSAAPRSTPTSAAASSTPSWPGSHPVPTTPASPHDAPAAAPRRRGPPSTVAALPVGRLQPPPTNKIKISR